MARAECVMAPIEITSTPVLLISRMRSRVTPPEASSVMRAPRSRACLTASARSRAWKLSSRITSAPASMASSSCARSSTSTAMRSPCGALARARRTASRTDPTSATWLSLIRIPEARSERWLTPPPVRTAYFSSARRPGVVLRVSVTRTLAPSAAATKAWVSVAIPERRCRKLTAVRSPASSA